jgi:hypothetical protein
MKRIFPLLILAIIFSDACKNSANKQESFIPSQMDFKKTTFDLGVIQNGHEKSCIFEFQNTSKGTLIISNVVVTCECTSTKWPKKPIRPGKSGTIKIKYHAAGVGPFIKFITVFSNAENSPIHLIIKGEIKL